MGKRADSASGAPPLVGWMESLCDGTRLRLLGLIERHELGVADLCDILQMPQSTVSRHLKILADQGWTACRRNGTANLYRMVADELDAPTRQLWALAREQITRSPSARQDQLRLTRLRKRHSEAESFFAGAAGEWDKLRSTHYGATFSTAAVLELLPADWTVVDLGCGTGLITAELAPHVSRVIGVDQSAAMLETARGRTGGLANVELHRGDLEDCPLEGGVADAAILSIVLTYVADPVVVLGEAARVVKPVGKVVVVDLLRHERESFRRQMGQQWPGFETQEMEKMLAEAGLGCVRCRALPPEQGVKGPALILAAGTRRPHEQADLPG